MIKKNKILVVLLILTMVISTVYTGEHNRVLAGSSYMIRVEGTDDYLYAGGDSVLAGDLKENDTSFQWTIVAKSDGSYWIQNRNSGKYMCLENQTGKVELLATIYEVWDSSKWILNISSSTTSIKNKWNSKYISVSGSDAVYGSSTQMFSLVEAEPNETETEEPFLTGGVADSIVIPETKEEINEIGANMPYTRYDSKQAVISGGATVKESKDFAKNNIASQASEQSYIELPKAGSYAEWTMQTTGNGITMRFTMPDSSDGMGQNGSLDVYVNGAKRKTVDLTSYYMWQYFEAPNPSVNPTGSPKDEPVANATASFAFDEVHFLLDTSLKKGDKIRIQSSGANNLVYGVDFLEIEEVGEKIEKPENAYSVTDYGAKPDDGENDFYYIRNCINAAVRDGKDVYIPEGTFELSKMLQLTNISDVKITGAGMWYTNLQFTSAEKAGGGISGCNANNVEFCNMYINSKLRSRYKQEASYKCFMDVWSGGSYIHDIWEEHFECGFWLADYSGSIEYSDGVKIVNNRIRNNFADGVNFCQGTSHATVYNCSIRNNGDDGLAMWNNNYLGAKDETNNVFCYNTIEFIWRAGGIAIYGGSNHKIYNNYISDTFMASGIHVNTAFDGYKFLNNSNGITFANNILVRSGTTSDSWNSDMAAVDITEPGGSVRNITFINTYIYDAQHDAVRITGSPSNITFNNLRVYGTGVDSNTTSDDDQGALFKFEKKTSSPSITVEGLEYANIAYSAILYGSRIHCNITEEKNLGNAYAYEIPKAGSTADIIIGGGSNENPQETTKTETPTKVVATNQNVTNSAGNETVTTGTQNEGNNHGNSAIVKPAKVKIRKVVRSKNNKKAKVTLKKVKGAKGYQIQYSTSKKFTAKKTKNVTSKKVTKVLKKLKTSKKYYIRARAYKIVGGKKYYGKWSASKVLKGKK